MTSRPIRVLLVEDDPDDYFLIQEWLSEVADPPLHLERLATYDTALAAMPQNQHDVYLVDYRLGKQDGLQLLRETVGHGCAGPVILLTGQDDRGVDIEAMKAGAVDYLMKGRIDALILERSIRYALERHRDRQALRQAHDELERRVRERTDELERANSALRESEGRFRGTFEQAALGMAHVDMDGQWLRVNQRLCDIVGYRREELVGHKFQEITHPDDLPENLEHFRRLQEGQVKAYSMAKRYFHKDGHVVWINLTVALQRDASGTPQYCISAIKDISDQMRIEESLQASEQQFRTLADSIPQLTWMTRPDGHIFWYNRRWYDYTGTTAQQMEGWGWQEVHDPNELPRVLANWRAALAQGEPWEDTFPLRRHDGQMRWHLSRAVPVRDEVGRILRWFGTNTDITDRIEMEQALKDASQRKDEFLAMLGHELRNPLAPIRTGLQVMKLAPDDRLAVEKSRAMMERQVSHMARIVDDLLDVSRVSKGKLTLQVERLDLGRLVRVVAEDHGPAFARAGLALHAEAPEIPVWVTGDRTRLSQVMDNLLQNAAKFTDRGGQVGLRLQADPHRGQAMLTVWDTGVGLDPDMLPRLFEVFVQGDHSLERSKGGLGLGLALVKGLAELHGGRIDAASAGPGQGAQFTVTLPLEPELAALSEMPAAPAYAEKRLRILVVEDNRDGAESLRMLLEFYGYEVMVAHTGPDGVKAALANHPHIVLCDIGLPGLDGYGVVGALRRDPATASARMIAVTGYGGEEERRRSQEAGFDQHLTKPVDPVTLMSVIAQV